MKMKAHHIYIFMSKYSEIRSGYKILNTHEVII